MLNVAPGYIATDLNKKERETEAFMTYLKTNIPVGRAGDPDEVAQLVGTLFDDNIGFLLPISSVFRSGIFRPTPPCSTV